MGRDTLVYSKAMIDENKGAQRALVLRGEGTWGRWYPGVSTA